MPKNCKVKGCSIESVRKAYCGKHYYGHITYDDPTFRVHTTGNTACKLNDCEFDHYALGYCRDHYRKFSRSGSPIGTRETQHTRCRVKYCRKPHCGKGYCQVHLKRWRRNGDPLKLIRAPYKKRKKE